MHHEDHLSLGALNETEDSIEMSLIDIRTDTSVLVLRVANDEFLVCFLQLYSVYL